MRIYNTYGKGSTEAAVTFIIATGIVAILFTWFFYDAIAVGGKTLNDFWQWYCNAYKFLNSPSEIVFVYSPPILWLIATSYIVSSLKAKTKEFNKKLNLKYIDFLPGRVNFCFNRPQYNFVCAYENIENLEMDIETGLIYLPKKYGATTIVDVTQLHLNLTVLNNKKFSLTTNQKSMNTIYSIIDVGRSVKEFSYKFSGLGEIKYTKEKIEKYQKYGAKHFLTNEIKVFIILMSIIFFANGLFISKLMHDPFAWPMIGVLISFILDIILIIDKANEKKRGF